MEVDGANLSCLLRRCVVFYALFLRNRLPINIPAHWFIHLFCVISLRAQLQFLDHCTHDTDRFHPFELRNASEQIGQNSLKQLLLLHH
jgi:hypothetical protein